MKWIFSLSIAVILNALPTWAEGPIACIDRQINEALKRSEYPLTAGQLQRVSQSPSESTKTVARLAALHKESLAAVSTFLPYANAHHSKPNHYRLMRESFFFLAVEPTSELFKANPETLIDGEFSAIHVTGAMRGELSQGLFHIVIPTESGSMLRIQKLPHRKIYLAISTSHPDFRYNSLEAGIEIRLTSIHPKTDQLPGYLEFEIVDLAKGVILTLNAP